MAKWWPFRKKYRPEMAKQETVPETASTPEADQPEETVAQTRAIDRIRKDYVEGTRKSFHESLEEDETLGIDTRNDPALRSLCDKIFDLKLGEKHDFVPTPTRRERTTLRAQLVTTLQHIGCAPDPDAAERLYKKLARHAHVALEHPVPVPGEENVEKRAPLADMAIPREEHGRIVYRDHKGRMRSAPETGPVTTHDLTTPLLMAWRDRLIEPTGEVALQKAFDLTLRQASRGDLHIKEIDEKLQRAPFAKDKGLWLVWQQISKEDKLPALYRKPEGVNANMQKIMLKQLETSGLRDVFVERVLLDYMLSEIRPVVWEMSENCLQEYAEPGDTGVKRFERFALRDQARATIKKQFREHPTLVEATERVLGVAERELGSPVDRAHLLRSVEELKDAGIRALTEYAEQKISSKGYAA